MTTTTMTATQHSLDTVYISPYEMRIIRPRGRPKLLDEPKAPPKSNRLNHRQDAQVDKKEKPH